MENVDLHLSPLAYHVELRDYVKSQEPALWSWFASAQAQAGYTENLRLQLLKSTYRLDADAHPGLAQAVEEVKDRLRLDIPVTLYQAQNTLEPNAALYYIPGEGHVVFSGPVLTLLGPEEIKSVIGHELAHHHLWRRDQGEFHITDRLIEAAANDPRATPSHEQTARRYQLYTEIFADRGSFCVTGDIRPVITGLVKLQTGLTEISAEAYLKQADEIFTRGKATTAEQSHPEAFIRARALALWQQQCQDATAQIHALIEGPTALDELDLIGQAQVSAATRHLLDYLLQPQWFRTPAVLGHAKLYFPDFQPAAHPELAWLAGLKFSDPKLQEYLCYVLLDFVVVDPDLEELPLAAAFDLCVKLDLAAQFEKLATKELKMKAREIKRIKEQAGELLAKTEAGHE